MRLTVTVDEARGRVRVEVDRALDYRPGQVCRALAAAAQRVAGQLGDYQPVPVAPLLVAGADEPAQPEDRHDPPLPAPWRVEPGTDRRLEVTRGRVLRALDRGATVAEAAARFGVDPALIDRWDDDAAADGHTDLLAAGAGGWSR